MSLELERAIANHAQSLWSLSIALHAAGDAICDDDDNATTVVVREIVQDYIEPHLSPATIVDVIVALVGLLAAKLNQPPKQIFEQLWKDAPTDAWWNTATKPPMKETDDDGS